MARQIRDLPDIAGLIEQLTRAEKSIQSVVSGQGDAVLDPATAAPSLLRSAQEWLWNQEAHLQQVQEAVAVGIINLDDAGTVTLANGNAQALLSESSRLLGTAFVDLPLRWVGTDGSLLIGDRHPAEAIQNGALTKGTLVGLLGADDLVSRWVLMTAEPVGTPARETVVTLADVTDRVNFEQLAETRARQHETVAELGQLALQGTPIEELLHKATAETSRVLDVELCSILELLPSRQELLLKAGIGWQEGVVGKAIITARPGSQAGYTLHSSGPVIVHDLPSDPRFSARSLLHEHKVVSGISVLIQLSNGVYGIMGAHTTKQRNFTRDDVHFVQSVANVLSSATERTRAEETIRLLSTPVLSVRDRLLLAPLIGTIDEKRAEQFTDQLLESVQEHRALVVVLDITGVSRMDSFVAACLLKAIASVQMLGARVVLTGVSTQVAGELVALRIGLGAATWAGDLQSALEQGERILAQSSGK